MTGIPDGTQGGIGFLWDGMDVPLRVDVTVLGLLLVHTFLLVVRVWHSYRLAQQAGFDSGERKGRVAELKGRVRTLQTISSTAPYLGLVGTCVGIFSAFGAIGMAKHAYLVWLTARISAALVPCAAGTIVAIAATCGHKYGCRRLELLANKLPGRNCLPTRGFAESAPFGLIAAWLLALLIRVFFIPFTPLVTYQGFEVDIAPVPCDGSSRSIVLRINERGRILLNGEEEQDWRTVQTRLSEIYAMRADRVVYLSADEGVSFQTVADAIDIVESSPEHITVRLVTPGGVNRPCGPW